jgi:hypothetical protein
MAENIKHPQKIKPVLNVQITNENPHVAAGVTAQKGR